MRILILALCSLICFSSSLSAQRYITPTSDVILDANFLLRDLEIGDPASLTEGMLPGLYFSYHKNAPFGRTYFQTSYNQGDLESAETSGFNLNISQTNVSLGYAHHIASYYPACKIMNPFLLGLIVKADLMNATNTVLNFEHYANTYSADIVFGHDFNFNSENRLEITFYTPLFSYYSVGGVSLDDTEFESTDKYIGKGETSLLFGGRKAYGGNAVYHLYLSKTFGFNVRYNFEKDDYSDPMVLNTLDHQISAGIVLHFD